MGAHEREIGVGRVGGADEPLPLPLVRGPQVGLDRGFLLEQLLLEVEHVPAERDHVLDVLLVRARVELRGHVERSQEDRGERDQEQGDRHSKLGGDGHSSRMVGVRAAEGAWDAAGTGVA